MILRQLLEKSFYKPKHKCLTPDAVYSTTIKPSEVSITVKLPIELELTKTDSEKLEADLHYAVEKVLAEFF